MSRVFWDAMLLVYLLENHKTYFPRITSLLARCYQRNDVLLTSYLALAEVLVGMPQGSPAAKTLLTTIEEMGFTFVEFNGDAVEPFRVLRSQFRLKASDAMHLACAASARTDLFLTGDKELLRKNLHVPGVQFVADFENAPL